MLTLLALLLPCAAILPIYALTRCGILITVVGRRRCGSAHLFLWWLRARLFAARQ